MMDKKERLNYILLSVYAVVLSFVCIGSSPILDYMCPDSQVFWTVGRSMASGKIAYVDVFDHKGLYLYFIEAIGALISSHNTWGLFILEALSNVVSIIMVYKIASLYLTKKNTMLVAMAYLGISFNFFTFVTGNLTETWSMVFQLISIWLLMKYYHSGKTEHPPVYMYVYGVTAFVVGMMRPNNAGMWIPFAIVLAIKLFKEKKIKNFFQNLLALILGVITGAIPLLIYGIKNKCFEDIWEGTFGANFRYSANNQNAKNMMQFLKEFICQPAFLIVLLGIISTILVLIFVKDKFLKITYISMFITTLIFMNISMRCDGQYYHLCMIFIIPFLIGFFKKFGNVVHAYIYIVLIVIATLVVNLQLIKQITKYGEYHYYQESAEAMKEIMDENPGDKVLVTGLNCVFYNVTDTLPHIKYFITFGGGLDYNVFPEPTDMQAESICSGENDYLIICFANTEKTSVYGIEAIDQEIMECLLSEYEAVYTNDNANVVLYRKLITN